MVCELNLNKADIYEGMIFASSSVSEGSSTQLLCHEIF